MKQETFGLSSLGLASRRSLIAGAASLGATLPMPAVLRAQSKVTLKYATNVNIQNPLNVRLSEAFDRIRKESNGAVDILLFPDNQLGSDPDMLSQLRSGALDMFHLSSVILARLVPACGVVGVGFAFPSYKEIWEGMDGDLGAHLRREIGKAGIHCQEKCWDLSFKEITTSNRLVRTPEDLKGLKLRIPPGPLWVSLFAAFEAAPATISMSETYSALQTRVVDGTELPLTTFYFARLYEVQKYISLTRHMWDGWLSLANKRTWDRLPREVSTLVSTHLDRSAEDHRRDVVETEARLVGELRGKGMEVIDVDQAPFRQKLQSAGFYREWKSKFGAETWGLLEKYTGAIS